jgi:AraC-like DNA-binding protein
VDVVALLPRQLLGHLRAVLGAEHLLIPTSDWADLHTSVQNRMVDVAVVDPAVTGSVHVETLQSIREAYPSLPVVIYTVLTASTMLGVVQLARSGIEHVVLNHFDDDPERFLDLLQGVPGYELGERLLRELHSPIGRLPGTIGRAVVQLYRSPWRFQGARDLAEAGNTTPRALYRYMVTAGIPSIRMVVVSARLVRAYAYLRDPGRSVKEIAARVGYRRVWQMQKHMRQLTGYVPSEVRAALQPDEFVALLARRVRRGFEKEDGQA